MLYQDRIMGRQSLWNRITASFAMRTRARRKADYDLLSMNSHLRRDIGVDESLERARFDDLRYR